MTQPYLRSAIVLLATLASAPAFGQQYGQWSWYAGMAVSDEQKVFRSGVDPESRSEFRSLRLNGGVDGFVIDPLIGAFHVAVNLGLFENSGSYQFDTQQFGGAAEIRILPRSAYPSYAWLTRQEYDRTSRLDDDALETASDHETATRWGARVRSNGEGFLRGLLTGVEQATSDGTDGTDTNSRIFAAWDGTVAGLQTRMNAELLDRRYGLLDYGKQDVLLTGSQTGEIRPTWQWGMSGKYLHTTIDQSEHSEVFDGADLYSSLSHQLSDRTSFGGSYVFGATTVASSTSQSHRLSGNGDHRLSEHVTLNGAAEWNLQRHDNSTAQGPSIGAGIAWTRREGRWQTSAGAGLRFSSFEANVNGISNRSQSVGGQCTLSANYTHPNSTNAEMSFGYSKDEARSSGNDVPGIPGSGATISGIGTFDRADTELVLSRRLGTIHTALRGTWVFTKSAEGVFVTNPFESEGSSASLQLAGRGWNFMAGNTQTTLDVITGSSQELSSSNATLRIGLWGAISLDAGYRIDDSRLDYAPDAESTRREAGLVIELAGITLDGHYYELESSIEDASDRTDRGLRFSVGTMFEGLLPVISAPKRRGTIR